MKPNTPTLRHLPKDFQLFRAVVVLTLMALAAVSVQAQYALTNLFSVAPGTGNLTTSTANRGFAFNAVSNQVLVASTAPSIGVFDGTTGDYLGNMDVSILSGGTFAVDQLGAASDGKVYGINLSLNSGSPGKIYQWANTGATATVAFDGNALANGGSISLTSGRLGDTMAVRGAGSGTEILCGVGGSHAFALFYTTDGSNFTNTIINVPSGLANLPNVFGLCFYTNNTFLVKQAGSGDSTVYLIQYPANYSSSLVVTGTVVASASLGATYNNTTMLAYTPSAGFLGSATPGSAPMPIALFDGSSIPGGAPLLGGTNTPAPNSNGNATGGVALGGTGQTNVIFAMATANGFTAWQIVSIPPQPPTVITAPVGGTFYLSNTLSVAVSGTLPFGYQWLASISNSATGIYTNISGATTNTLTINTLSTNYYQVIVTNTVGAYTSPPVQVTIIAPVNNSSVTQLWRIPAGTSGYSYLSSSDNAARSIAYDTNSQRVVVSTTAGPTLNVVDAVTGTNIGPMSLSGYTPGGIFSIDQVRIADDGAVYTCNLSYNANIIVNRWGAPTTTAVPLAGGAFNGYPGTIAERYGDNMAIRGGGANTEILIPSSLNPGIGVGPGTNVVLLTTTDGTNFTATILGISGVPGGFAGSGIAFDTGNTFWAKSYNGDLFKIAYDPNSGVGSVLFDYSSSGEVPQTSMGLGIDPVLNIMATIVQSESPDDLQMFQLTGSTAPPVLFNQTPLSDNVNANANAAIDMKNGRLFATDVNNGIVGLSYTVPTGTPPSIVTPPASTTAFTNTAVSLSVAASGSLPLNYQWRFNSNNITGANSQVYTLTNPPLTKAGFYDVVVYNGSGSVTSAPALLTIKIPVLSTVVTQLWTLAPGSRTYLDSSTYNTRGLAYDPMTGRLLVADHFNIYLLNATNGADLGMSMNVLGLPTTGFSQWLVDQVRVADDGAVYACNLQDNSFGAAPLSIIGWPSADPSAVPFYAYGSPSGADPSGIGARLGDTLAVRGGGLNTQLLMGTPDANIVVWFTNDVNNPGTFIPTVITVTNAPAGFASRGVAFGAGNTFWAKGINGYSLREVTFDPASPGTASATRVFTAGAQVPSIFLGLSLDVTNHILAGVSLDDSPDDLQLYLLSGNSNPPALFNQSFFPGPFGNIQLVAATDIKYPWAFGLDVNNGIIALNYGVPAAPTVTLTGVEYAPGNVTINWNNTFVGHGYQVQYKNSLSDVAWTNLGSPVRTSNAAASFSDTTATGNTRFYRVVSQ